jgi:hypothetical protein
MVPPEVRFCLSTSATSPAFWYAICQSASHSSVYVAAGKIQGEWISITQKKAPEEPGPQTGGLLFEINLAAAEGIPL